jgi:hypothetical protein
MTVDRFYRSWLEELLGDVNDLPAVSEPRPYWSQRRATTLGPNSQPVPLATVVDQVRALIDRLERDHYFAQNCGYECIDGDEDGTTSRRQELQTHLGKAHLMETASESWSVDDLCDFIEIHHDLTSRPTAGYFHSYGGCGWHPSSYAVAPGQAIYRWRMNRLLDATGLQLRLAEAGEDRGRMVRASTQGEDLIVEETLETTDPELKDQVAHAIALFRSRRGGRPQMRSAIVVLAGILESRRLRLKDLLTKDEERRLFEIANRYGIRHQNDTQLEDYGEEFLEWIFFSYLNTVNLSNRLIDERL